MSTVALRPREPEEYRLDVELHASLTALREARTVIRDLDELAPHSDLRFVAELLTAELVSNVLRHAAARPGDPFTLTVEHGSETLRVEVADTGAGFNPLTLLRIHSANQTLHRGIFLIHILADRWGFRRDRGCRLWFELDLVPGRRAWNGREPICV